MHTKIKTILFIFGLRRGFIVDIPNLFHCHLWRNPMHVLKKDVDEYLKMMKVRYRLSEHYRTTIYFDKIQDAAYFLLKFDRHGESNVLLDG